MDRSTSLRTPELLRAISDDQLDEAVRRSLRDDEDRRFGSREQDELCRALQAGLMLSSSFLPVRMNIAHD